METIYKEFQIALKINQETANQAKTLHEGLSKKPLFRYESPYLIAAICIYAISCLEMQPKSLKEISKISHITETDLRRCYERVFGELEDGLKRL